MLNYVNSFNDFLRFSRDQPEITSDPPQIWPDPDPDPDHLQIPRSPRSGGIPKWAESRNHGSEGGHPDDPNLGGPGSPRSQDPEIPGILRSRPNKR